MRRLNAAALLGSVMIVTVGCGGGGEVEVEGEE